MTRWEYLTEIVRSDKGEMDTGEDLDKVLDDRGWQGWELVGIEPMGDARGDGIRCRYVFKRGIDESKGKKA